MKCSIMQRRSSIDKNAGRRTINSTYLGDNFLFLAEQPASQGGWGGGLPVCVCIMYKKVVYVLRSCVFVFSRLPCLFCMKKIFCVSSVHVFLCSQPRMFVHICILCVFCVLCIKIFCDCSVLAFLCFYAKIYGYVCIPCVFVFFV